MGIDIFDIFLTGNAFSNCNGATFWLFGQRLLNILKSDMGDAGYLLVEPVGPQPTLRR